MHRMKCAENSIFGVVHDAATARKKWRHNTDLGLAIKRHTFQRLALCLVSNRSGNCGHSGQTGRQFTMRTKSAALQISSLRVAISSALAGRSSGKIRLHH